MKAHSKMLIGKKAKVKRKKAKVKGRFTLTFFLLPSYFLLLLRVGGAARPLALQHAVARAWAAQLRLCARFRRLAARKTSKNLVVAAIARELAGFLWAEMTA